jgi:tetratricopeptide (TPR) repeat protein
MFSDAARVYEEVLRVWEKSYGRESLYTVVALSNLGTAYQKAGRLAEATNCAERALHVASNGILRPDKRIVIPLLLSLAELYAATDRKRDAENYLRRAVTEVEAGYGTDHPIVAKVLFQYVATLRQWRRNIEAARMERQAKAILARNAERAPKVHISELAR